MVVYISGGITNNPNYKLDFEEAKTKFQNLGYKVINPAEIQMPIGCDKWEDYMIVYINLLVKANTIYMLKNYEQSKGAMIELEFAKQMGLKILYENS